MNRDLAKLVNQKYDLLVVGGGIAGAFAAWDAALRGLSVALIEKEDFGGATSAASGKLIHGGVRFLQYGAFNRVIESLHERMVFRRMAPHMIKDVPFIIPTYGHLMKGKEILRIGMAVYELLSRNKRNSGDPQAILPVHRMLSRRQVIEREEGLSFSGLNGGILYYECQMHNPERLTLSVVFAAREAGAQVFNYTEATGFIEKSNRVYGIKVCDRITGNAFEVKAKIVLNAAGPWVYRLLDKLRKKSLLRTLRYSKGIHIVTRPVTRNHAVALTTRHRNAESLLQRGGRHYFIIPWRGRSLIGTTNEPFDGHPDGKMVSDAEIAGLIQEVNSAYPSGKLTREDVLMQYGGLYLDDEMNAMKGYQGSRNDRVIDHDRSDNIKGLVTSVCVKYTTARKLAQRTIDVVFEKLGYTPPDCRTDQHQVFGGRIEQFGRFLEETVLCTDSVDEDVTRQLVSNYGDRYRDLFRYFDENPEWCGRVHRELPIIKAQLIHAVRKEMAQKLSDVVFRRTGICTVGNPGDACLKMCAEIVARELNWTKEQAKHELSEVYQILSV